MYNEFYGFSEKPFEITPDPKFLYLTSSHQEALNAMMKGIKTRQSFISITGEVGTGKTTLIYHLLMSLNDKVKTAFIFNTSITFEEFLEMILRERYLEVTEKDKNTLINQLVDYLSHISNDETMAVIIDEAQHLSKETLLQLEKLSDMEQSVLGRFQIVFVGQPEFENMVKSSSLKILNQRISIRSILTIMTAKESRSYIEHRLNIVGSSTSKIFTPEATSVIIDHAQGIPRVINIVCDNALLNGFSESKKKIDAEIIREVIKNLEGPPLPKIKLISTFSSDKVSHPINSEKIITKRKISFIFLLLLSLVGIVYFYFLQGGPLNIRNIESVWFSLFHKERPLFTIPKTTNTTTLKADMNHQPVATVVLPAESNHPVIAPAVSSLLLSRDIIPTGSIIVKTGQSISRLAKQYYGRSNITCVDLILDSNPEITNANLISVKQIVKMPKITERNLIVQSSDRTYKINVGTFKSPKFAELYRKEASLRGKEIEIIARKAIPEQTWYRVVVGKFESEDEALKVIFILKDKKLLPFFVADTKLK
jgi:type II secretory pathway predicted ATPase ExeA